MLARTPALAVQGVTEPLQRALSCVTPSVLLSSERHPRAGLHEVSFPGGAAVRLRGAQRLLLRLYYALEVVEVSAGAGRWSALVAGYAVRFSFEHGAELLSFHWHPGGASPIVWPHLHVAGPTASLDLSRAHVPTGVVGLPAILRFAIGDLGVRPLRADWPAVLAAAERALAGEPT